MIVKLKWNKVEWRKDQLVGKKWNEPETNYSEGASLAVEKLLDKYHKSLWFKKEKKLSALRGLASLLRWYLDANQDNDGAKSLIQKRLKEVGKKSLQYGWALDFARTLEWKDIKANPYLLDA